MRFLALVVLCTAALVANAQQWKVYSISPMDEQYMEVRKEEINSFARSKIGRSFGQGRDSDLAVMQEILDRRLLDGDETTKLQAMGIIMGEHLRREHRLRWVVYIDDKGRSRALEIPDKDEVIFPVTQISARAAVGADIDVKAIYQKLEAEIARIKKKIIVR